MNGARNEENFMQERARPPENHAAAHDHHHQPQSPPQRCPRCDSSNTKFCYYNNYSLSQPRYFCKACRRYWTHGGTLRNVPVGGGCRKAKRPRISSPPSLSSSLIPRNPAAAARPLNLTGVIPGQPSRAAAPPLGGAYYGGGGSFLSSLAAMQSFPAAGINQRGAAMDGGGRLGANMALLQGVSIQSLKSQAAAPPHQHSPTPAQFFPLQQNLIPPGAFSSWSQSAVNPGATSSSAAAVAGNWGSGGGGSGGGGDRAGSSFTASKWSDCSQGFNPSE